MYVPPAPFCEVKVFRKAKKTAPANVAPTEPPFDEEARSERLAHKVVTLLARGNVCLQLGCFDTADDLEAERKSFENYEF